MNANLTATVDLDNATITAIETIRAEESAKDAAEHTRLGALKWKAEFTGDGNAADRYIADQEALWDACEARVQARIAAL